MIFCAIGIWVLSGLVGQFIGRVVWGEPILAGPQYWFWSFVAGPLVLIAVIVQLIIDLIGKIKGRGGDEQRN